MALAQQRLHGRRGRIEVGSGSPLNIVGSLNAWTISFTRDKTDVTSFEDENKVFLVGLKDLSGTIEGFFDPLYWRGLMEAAESATGCVLKIIPSLDAPTFYYEGPAWLDLTNAGSVNDAIKVTGTFSANGAWTLQVDGSPI